MRKLTKKEMKNNLGLAKEDIELVWEYQETFTQFWDNDCGGFCVNGEILCNELEVKDDFTSWLLADRKSVKGKLIKYRCVENTDFVVIREISENSKGGRPKTIIELTLECAKKIAIRQNNEKGDLVCNYFILMEKIVNNYEKWKIIREDEKKGYNILKQSLEEKAKRDGKRLSMTDYCEEANSINQALFGYTAWELKNWCGKDTTIRDSFSIEENRCIDELQKADIMLMDMGFDFKTRKNKLKEMVENRGWSNIKIPYDDMVEKLATGGNE
jgi:phage anti-repressor protein